MPLVPELLDPLCGALRLAELRALPVKALKEAMGRLGLAAVAGSEKEDLVQEVAQKLGVAE